MTAGLTITLILASLAQITTGPAQKTTGDLVIPQASIRAQNDVRIPAEVDGVLRKLPVREGSHVKAGDLLAAIDDRQAKAQLDVARLTLESARKKAEDDIEERYAVAAAKYAKVDWKRDMEANRDKPGAVSDTQLDQKHLAFEKADLQTEKARNDAVIARKEADVKEAEMMAAQVNLDRRTIRAPFDGEVQQRFKKESEWANPGDPILRLVQFELLQVDGTVNAQDYDPVDIAGRPVTIHVKLAHGEAKAEGRVMYVSQAVEADGDYLVRAEIKNERQGDYWLIRPGLPATMTIHLGETPVAVPAQGTNVERK